MMMRGNVHVGAAASMLSNMYTNALGLASPLPSPHSWSLSTSSQLQAAETRALRSATSKLLLKKSSPRDPRHYLARAENGGINGPGRLGIQGRRSRPKKSRKLGAPNRPSHLADSNLGHPGYQARVPTTHAHARKRVLRYIAGTLDYGITYTRGEDSTLVGFCDSDWVGDIDGRRSVTGYCFSQGSGVISWISKKQPTVALSSIEAEYKPACFTSCEALWLRRLLGDMGAVQEQPTMLLCDNQSCMAIARNPVFHARTKHIEVQYHFVRELILDGEVEMEYCPTMDNCADIFTKALGSKTLERHLHQIGVGPKQ
ncbi:hypothetical protein L7F22_066109 [Adiantum nelumboides]|nr:hypothetical protein [Adiantum nelumboides]